MNTESRQNAVDLPRGSLTHALTDQHLENWRRDGYCIVESFVRPDVIEATLEELHRIVPTWDQFVSDRSAWPDAKPLTWLQFPYRSGLMNDLVLNPELIAFSRRALDCDDIVLSHSEALCKYAADHDFDQQMHMDYPNNTFAVPVGDNHEQLASITYLTDVTIDLGPTRVVSFADSARWRHATPWSRDDAPELFEREHEVVVPAGSILLYSMRTFHRGSAFLATEGERHSIHTAYQRRAMSWGGWRSFVVAGPAGWMSKLLTRLTPEQRSMIGFPPVGDAYWSPEAIEAVQRRYPDMDMAPYT